MNKEDIDYIYNVLRRGTITWPGRTQCLNRGRYKAPTPDGKRLVWWRDCDKCGLKTMLKEDLLEVDHIKEIGGFCGDWNATVSRMYCGQDNLQALCIPCHARKTAVFSANLRFTRKTRTDD